MYKSSALPFLPGMSFDSHIGQTRFHKSHLFDHRYGACMLADGIKKGIGGVPLGPPTAPPYRVPCVYARGEAPELPAWIVYEKNILSFDAYFQETLQEFPPGPTNIRRVTIQFYLEDGTVKVLEPEINNSGMWEGTKGVMISRQRIPYPRPNQHNFYDILDFNVGVQVELFGRTFKITNCDRHTRVFLNRMGISVPDPIETPEDLYIKQLKDRKDAIAARKPNTTVDTLGKFLNHDRQVLRFSAYWDDRGTECGEMHHLEVLYFLSDDTISIREVVPENSGRDSGFPFLRREKLAKFYKGLPMPGAVGGAYTVLNVLGVGSPQTRYMSDRLCAGYVPVEYYTDRDLTIGAQIEVYGRIVVLTDCDPYTQEYYRVKYGIENFTPMEKPHETPVCVELPERELPLWNGFGSYEDSAQNCITVEPKAPHTGNLLRLIAMGSGLDSHILKFRARMHSKIPENNTRAFVISYYMADDTIQVFEFGLQNSGFPGGVFCRRAEVPLPGQEEFRTKPPEMYRTHHMYVGAHLEIAAFHFELQSADDYALRYMELHPKMFPKSDIKLIMGKIKEAIGGKYKQYIAKYLPCVKEFNIMDRCISVMPTTSLSIFCKELLGDNIVEQEIITLGRHFAAERRGGLRFSREEIRALLHTEIRRFIWDDLERFEEHMQHLDHDHTGFLDRHTVDQAIKACRLPIDKVVIERILDVVRKNEACEIDYHDLIDFFNIKICPLPGVIPYNVKFDLYWGSELDPTIGEVIDFDKFVNAIGLEESLKK